LAHRRIIFNYRYHRLCGLHSCLSGSTIEFPLTHFREPPVMLKQQLADGYYTLVNYTLVKYGARTAPVSGAATWENPARAKRLSVYPIRRCNSSGWNWANALEHP